jgi:rare lipoprotein A
MARTADEADGPRGSARGRARVAAQSLGIAVALLCGGCAQQGARAAPPRHAPERGGRASVAAPGWAERGRASYYADRLAGRPTASGQPYDPGTPTAAHRMLPFGTVVDVARDDGRHVVVRINDRGPTERSGRIIDLSRSAAEALGMIREGVVAVTVRVLALPGAGDSRR